MKKKHFKHGFSLLELLIVIVVIGIIASVSIPKLKQYFNFKTYNAARILVSDIHYAQTLAETTQINHGIMFYPDEDKYIVYEGTVTLPASEPHSKKPMIRDFKSSHEFSNVDIISAEFPVGAPTRSVEFNPMGIPIDAGKIIISYDNEIYEIEIIFHTGKVLLQKL